MKKRTLSLSLLGFVLAASPFALLKAQMKSHASLQVPPPLPSKNQKIASTEALTLWKRLRDAGGPTGIPIVADVVVTNFAPNGSLRRQVKITMQEGQGEQYRLTYTSPDNVRGRIVVFDGVTLYQYEPARNIVLKRSVESDEAALLDSSGNITGALVPIIEGSDRIMGHEVQKLALQDHQGHVVRRCFIDNATGRSLLTEEFAPDNHKLLRRVEKTRFELSQNPDGALFQPSFPKSARILASSTRRGKNLEVEKRNLGLPEKAGSYRLRTVLHPTTKTTGDNSHQKVHHAIYANGVQTVSVFVTPLSTSSAKLTPPEGHGWQQIEVTKGAIGFAREDDRGRSGVVWLREGRRYVMAARLPLNEVLTIAHDLCKTL